MSEFVIVSISYVLYFFGTNLSFISPDLAQLIAGDAPPVCHIFANIALMLCMEASPVDAIGYHLGGEDAARNP